MQRCVTVAKLFYSTLTQQLPTRYSRSDMTRSDSYHSSTYYSHVIELFDYCGYSRIRVFVISRGKVTNMTNNPEENVLDRSDNSLLCLKSVEFPEWRINRILIWNLFGNPICCLINFQKVFDLFYLLLKILIFSLDIGKSTKTAWFVGRSMP